MANYGVTAIKVARQQVKSKDRSKARTKPNKKRKTGR